MELHRGNATRRSRRPRRLAAALLVMGAGLGVLTMASAAASTARAGITVVGVKGLIDPTNVSLVRHAIDDANAQQLTMVVLQIDSPGAVADVQGLLRVIDRSKVPVVAWVGPSGAQARGAAVLLVEAAHRAFISQGSDVGSATPVRADDPAQLSAEQAAKLGATDGVRPTVGEAIVQLDGTTVRTAAGDVELSTAKVIGKGTARRRQPNQQVVFTGLGVGAQIQHGLVNSSAAYFLLVVGLALLVFEFFAASVGFATVVGALAVVGACFGFSHLPVHWWAIGLLVISALGFAVDAQAGGLGFWTGVGVITLIIGTLTLYRGDGGLRPPWWIELVVGTGAVIFYGFAVPTFIRARFSTPTIGREGMVGEVGTAELAIDPDGVVVVRGARWRARTNRATPLATGDAARVIAVNGLVLEVEPEQGGAKDYRERSRRRKSEEPN